MRSADPRLTDGFFVSLSRAADHSKLWIAISLPLLADGDRGRRGATRGLAAVAVTSAVTNLALKPAFRRPRPGRRPPLIPPPRSFSFPSGHSASAFAFATAVSRELPDLAPLLVPLAGAVAYSRVRTGVHHPGDVLLGSAVGAAFGLAVAAVNPSRIRRPGTVRPQAGPPDLTEAILVTSPHAGGSNGLAAARDELRRRGLTVIAELGIEQVENLPVLLAGRGRTLVIAAGGDGTVGTVADCLANTDHVLGVLPLGTSNDFARTLGIPVNPAQAAALLVEGKVSTIDLGRFVPVGQLPRHFVHAATVGLNANFARIATQGKVRDRLGRFTYLLAAAHAMRRRPAFRCELRFGSRNEKLALTQLSVINAPIFGGPLRLSIPASDPDDRLLDILAVEDVPPVRMLLSGLAMLLRSPHKVPGIRIWHTTRMHVHADQSLDVTLDGELIGTLPGDFEVVGEALHVITPLAFVDIEG
jgi:undecaprenyl-diphosphatase